MRLESVVGVIGGMKILGLALLIGLVVVSWMWVESQPEVRLLSRTIRPGLAIQGFVVGGPGERHAIIQLPEIPSEEDKIALESEGIKLLEYIPDNAWFASIEGPLQPGLAAVPIIPEDKVSPNIRSNGAGEWGKSGDFYRVSVIFFSDSTEGEVQEALDFAHSWGKPEAGNVWTLEIGKWQALELAAFDAVRWVEDIAPPLEDTNDDARELSEVDTVQGPPLGLNGTGIVLAVWDSGYANHTDLTGRISRGDPNEGSNGSHATHVTGTMAGSGSASSAFSGTGYEWKGMSPNATILTYEWPDSGSAEALDEANNSVSVYGARVSQNSWGYLVTSSTCYVIGSYDSFTQSFDNITTGLGVDRAMTVVFSAGNERDDTDCGQTSRLYNTTPGPGSTAKNVITVGAVDDSGGMSSFSSWGPLNDGRIKPDVVANGIGLYSTSVSGGYATMSGTSMASPVVSGIIGLLYEAYNQTHAALQNPPTNKALLIHTATDQNNTGPDFSTGYGLVNASTAVQKIRQDINSSGLIKQSQVSDSENVTYYLNVTGPQLKATLVWYDYPATLGAASDLINNLDLMVLAPGGSRQYPWTLSTSTPAASAVRTQADSVNNMEQVVVDSPSAGNYTIIVSGTSVPQAPQNFTLIVDDTQPPKATSLAASVANGSAYPASVQFNSTWADDFLLDAAILQVNGTNYTATKEGTEYYYTITGLGAGNWEYTWYANDTSGNWNASSSTLTLVGQATLTTLLLNGTDGNETYSPADAINITARLNVSGTVYLDLNATGFGDNFTNGSGSVTNITSLGLGYYNVTAHFGGSGNFSASSAQHFITVDSAPQIRLDYPQNNSFVQVGGYINLSVTDAGLDSVTYNKGSGNTSLASPFDIQASGWDEGSTSLDVWAIDTDGNVGHAYYRFTLDGASPMPVIMAPANTTYTSTNTSLTYFVSESNPDSAYYSLNGGSNVTLSGNTTITAEQGSNTLQLFANDSSGHLNSTQVVFYVDSVSPAISSASLNSTNLGPGDNVTITASYNDTSLSEGWANITNSSGWYALLQLSNSSNATYNVSGLGFGNYSVTAFANDTAGNSANLSASAFRVSGLRNVTLSIRNANGSLTPASKLSVLYNGTNTTREESTNSTGLSRVVPNGTWDIFVHSGFNSTLYGTNITGNTSENVSIDSGFNANTSLPSHVNQFIAAVGLSTGFNFTKAGIKVAFNKSLLISQSRVNTYACHSWSLSNRSCNTSWENATANSTFNLTGNTTTVNTTSLSGFAVAEAFSCGDGFVDSGETESSCCQDTGCSSGTCNTGTGACAAQTNTDTGGSSSGGGGGGSGGGGATKTNASSNNNTIPIEEHVVCAEGESKCSAGGLETCANNSWEFSACEFGCTSGECNSEPAEPEPACAEGGSRCNANSVEVCLSGEWVESQECEACESGKCVSASSSGLYWALALAGAAIAVAALAIGLLYYRKKRGFALPDIIGGA